MSDQKESPDSTSDRDESPVSSADGADADNDVTGAEGAESPTRPGSATGWIALLVGIAALSVSGWQWWQQSVDASGNAASARVESLSDEVQRLSDTLDQQSGEHAAGRSEQARRIDELDQQFGAVNQQLEEQSSRLTELSEQRDEPEVDVAGLRESIQAQAETSDRLQSRLASLNDRVESTTEALEQDMERLASRRDERMSETLARAEFRLGLTEVAGLLRLGQSSAESSHDIGQADAVYERALSRLQQMEDGRVDRVRERVAGELDALRGTQTIDWAALVGRLARLESQLADWPLAGRGEPADEEDAAPDAAAGESAEQPEGWWSGVRRSLGGLVRVTPRASAPLSPAAAESVRERLRLHLAGAQASASLRSLAELDAHLGNARSLVADHFESDARPVREALAVIDEAGELEAARPPELGGALSEVERLLADS